MRISKIRFTFRVVGLMFCLLLAALLIFVAWQPPLPQLNRQNVPLTLLGYTNSDTSFTRLAIFAVTNLAMSDIRVYRPMVTSSNVSGRPVYNAFNWPAFQAVLGRDASAEFTVPVPTNLSPWRVNLLADPDVGAARAIVRTLRAFPFGRAARRMPYGINSDWIDNQK
jgi:hypothetical protein